MSFSEFLTDIKTAAATAGITIGTGIGTLIDLIPNDIGKLSSVVGMMLAIVLIFTHLRKGAADHEKTMLEIAALKEAAVLRARANDRDTSARSNTISSK